MKQQPHETDGPPRDGLSRVKQGRHKPEVPPRRNPPPSDTSVKSKAPSCAHRSRISGVLEKGPTIAERVGPTQKGPANALPESSLPPPLERNSSSPLPIEEALIKGGDSTSARPSVTFAPNPMILLTTDSDGSPVKLASKESGKRLRAGNENAKLPSQTENQGALVSSLKKAGEEVASSQAASRPEEPEDCHLRDLYTQVNDLVSANPDEMKEVNEDEAEDPSAVPMIWVSKWVDYTDKYGLGYQLSDDSIGVLFNDFTKLLLLPDGENIHYIERSGKEHYHQLNDHPDSLHKKVTLLRYFRNYMNEHLLKAGAKMVRQREGDELARIPSLKTHCRTRSAIVLLLTNGTLQINFFEDHTKIILCPLMGAVTYIDKKRNFRTFRLEMLKKFGCSNDLANRLRYARNMIQKLLLLKSGSSIKLGSAGLVAFPQPSPHSKQVT